MFSCCVPVLRQKFVYIKHMRLHDFLDLPTVELARSENTKREDRAGMIRWQSQTGPVGELPYGRDGDARRKF